MGTHNFGGNLTNYMDKLFNEQSGYARYLGVVPLPWQRNTTYHKFQVQDDWDDNYDWYYRTDTMNLEWTYSSDNQQVIRTPKGYEPMTFTDADFVINGCNPNWDSLATVRSYTARKSQAQRKGIAMVERGLEKPLKKVAYKVARKMSAN